MAIYNSSYTGAEVDASVAKTQAITKTAQEINNLNQVNANPTLAGTEGMLEGLQVATTKYKLKNIIDATNDTSLLPTSNNTSGVMIFVFANESDVSTEYNGYMYLYI